MAWPGIFRISAIRWSISLVDRTPEEVLE